MKKRRHLNVPKEQDRAETACAGPRLRDAPQTAIGATARDRVEVFTSRQDLCPETGGHARSHDATHDR